MGGKVNDCKGKVVKSKNRISLIGEIRIMAIDITFILILAAAVVTGLLAGVSLAKSIVQLPARHRMGIVEFAAFSRAADLGNG